MRFRLENIKLNWSPELPDIRDYTLSSTGLLKSSIKLPQSVDLSQYCSPIEDQEKLGSCTSNAVCGLLEFNDKKPDGFYVDLSRLFIYYNARSLMNTVNKDSGVYIRTAIKSLVKWGACSESKWPYIITKFKVKPSGDCYNNALGRKIKTYNKVSRSLKQMKQCLVSGHPFVFGFSVYNSFESAGDTGIALFPSKKDVLLGGHAAMVVGYDDKTSMFKVRNSWGKDWGNMGYFFMPYDYLTSSKLSSDFWTIIL